MTKNKVFVVFATKGVSDPEMTDEFELALLIAADMLKISGAKRAEVFEVTPTSYRRVAVRVS